jgi:hypothetical protein
MSLAGVFSDDIDYSVYCISAPYGAAWSADYFDAIDVLQWHVLLVPENAGKGVRIHAATVDHNQNLVRISSVRAADADGPVVGIDLGYINPGNHTQDVRNAGGPRMLNIILCNDEDCRRNM